ncbi:hypothetical protein [uncultured Flavobacterium sp.]|uniref:hypothetical protein n=1 Tax=uncultured Flavobacterium sp. TaxID=165435 RepID=UPI0030EEF3F3
MMSFEDIEFTIKIFHKNGLTVDAAELLIREYELSHPNFKGIELREKAKPDFILMTTEGEIGQPQIVRIPENTFEFPLVLMLNLLAHEMLHVRQKSSVIAIQERNEREWQAYYEMLFHEIFPLIPEASDFHKKHFATKGLEYYNRMGSATNLQLKYAIQKREVETLLDSLV